ncbi:MAG: glycosyltransferase [Cyclobacteriaceae bacterium]
MKIVLLANRKWVHTVNWANTLDNLGHDIHVLSMHCGADQFNKSVKFHKLIIPAPVGYYLNVFQVKRLLRKINPDLLHAHYASGYGTLNRLTNFSPNILSMWGSDVYEFPSKSKWHHHLISKNLKHAEAVFSTSNSMADHVKSFFNYSSKIWVTPFGVDLDTFHPGDIIAKQEITLGTVKKLESKYGIDLLLKAFKKLLESNDPVVKIKPIKLLIVGSGSKKGKLLRLSKRLKIEDSVQFINHIPHSMVPHYLRQLDVYFALSRSDSESFGVAILEASACQVPVITSNKGGLPEVVRNEETGYIISEENIDEIVEKSVMLINNEKLRAELGKNGRSFVQNNYSEELTVEQMIRSYREVLSINRK